MILLKLAFLFGLLLILPVLAEGMVVIGVTPAERNICVAPGFEASADFTLSTNSSGPVSAQLAFLGADWLAYPETVNFTGNFASLRVWALPPNGTAQGNYPITVYMCLNTEKAEGVTSVNSCVKPSMSVTVSDACAPPPLPPEPEQLELKPILRAVILLAIAIVLSILLFRKTAVRMISNGMKKRRKSR